MAFKVKELASTAVIAAFYRLSAPTGKQQDQRSDRFRISRMAGIQPLQQSVRLLSAHPGLQQKQRRRSLKSGNQKQSGFHNRNLSLEKFEIREIMH